VAMVGEPRDRAPAPRAPGRDDGHLTPSPTCRLVTDR
jgi:hypothetical protein